ncbi:MAG: cytochrome c oxidase subunit II [Saprospiraceae bacterium]|nr:cytochrome c oxidase subunit II [Saprospiraceae bacterium]
MTTLVILGCILLVGLVIFQIARINEMIKRIKGEEEAVQQSNDNTALSVLLFGIVFLALALYTSYHYKDRMFGYGPMVSASKHGVWIDHSMHIMLVITGIVFVLTHILLFYFVWKYRYKKNRLGWYYPHNNKLEAVWTITPFIVLAYLAINGLVVWNKMMEDVKPGEDHIEIEVTGMQFAWLLRYPGMDGKLGTKNYKLISGTNDLGQDWNDPKNWDDFKPDEIVLPKGKKIRVRINSRDVLHSFFLPHFRVKMDAVPGMPTYFIFTPTMTTDEFRNNLKKYPEWNVPADPSDPESKMKWETFDFELACAELCGNSHFAMRRAVRIVTPEQYDEWVKSQKSYYLANIRGKAEDPNQGKTIKINGVENSGAPAEKPAEGDAGVKADSTKAE